MTDVVNRFDSLYLDAGFAGYVKPLAALMTLPLVCIADSDPTFPADDLDGLQDIGRKRDGGWQNHPDGFPGMVGKPQVVA